MHACRSSSITAWVSCMQLRTVGDRRVWWCVCVPARPCSSIAGSYIMQLQWVCGRVWYMYVYVPPIDEPKGICGPIHGPIPPSASPCPSMVDMMNRCVSVVRFMVPSQQLQAAVQTSRLPHIRSSLLPLQVRKSDTGSQISGPSSSV